MPNVYSAHQHGLTQPHGGYTAQNAREVIDSVLAKCGETRKRELWGAYTVGPRGNFVNKQADEEVVLMLRAHPITNVPWILLVLLMLVAPELLMLIGIFGGMPVKILFVGKMVWYLMILGYSFERFLYWYYSLVIITNERVVDIDFVHLLHRSVSYAALNHIEQPSMISGGLMRSIFHYGDVTVATAAETSLVEANAVPYPDRVVRIISELSEELEKRRERGE